MVRLRMDVRTMFLLASLAGAGTAADGGAATPRHSFAMVRAAHEQTGGPAYDFRIAVDEVRNDQFAEFLNDAFEHVDTPRGQFMYHDTDSGSVYLHDSITGAHGSAAPSASLTVRLYDGALGRIHFSAETQKYVVDAGFEAHPVVAVSWYGAAKYCNWLTILAEMPLQERAYTEGVSIDDWGPLPFDPADPASNRAGYRLPMDGGLAEVGPYNEWLKAASAVRDDNAALTFASVYAFGRDALTARDANYFGSGDPFDDDTTPVGFFDGLNRLADEITVTLKTENAYGLHDLCGNVAEWVHDLDLGGGFPRGAMRGGHFLHPIGFSALRAAFRETVPADGAYVFVGFRVAQSLAPVAPRLGDAGMGMRAVGLAGGPISPQEFTLEIHNDAAYTLDNPEVTFDAPWLELDLPEPFLLPPGSMSAVRIRFASTLTDLPVSPPPPGDFVLISGTDDQSDGPTYDFWISRTEVTNDQFVVFLNDARANRTNERGAFMYHDLESGSVYMQANVIGDQGTAPPGDPFNVLLYDSGVGRIRFSGDEYAVEEGFGRHPVVGVTWFGALKYCNWLTLFAGLPAGVRAYSEGPSVEDWHPATVDSADWLLRGIDDSERAALVERAVGYRLPMDHASETAAAYNEWYKAASARADDAGLPVFDARYGFGRDDLYPEDANYLASGDTQIDGTTVVSHFDGNNTLADGMTLTRPTHNYYGIADLSGNVAEWTADFFLAGDGASRSVRGGSWADAGGANSLTTSGRTPLSPEDRNQYTGFRVARGAGHVATISLFDPISDTRQTQPVILDLLEPVRMTPRADGHMDGIYCDDFAGRSMTYELRNSSASAISWVARFDPPADWLSLSDLEGSLPAASKKPHPILIQTTAQANRLPPGEHITELVWTNLQTGTVFTRQLKLAIEPPIAVQADASNPQQPWSAVWRGTFEALPPLLFSLVRADGARPDCALNFTVATNAPWLVVTAAAPGGALSGVLPGKEALMFEVRTSDEAQELQVGEHEGEILFAFSDPANAGMMAAPVRERVRLNIDEPMSLETDPWTICCRAADIRLAGRPYMLANRHPTLAIPVGVEADVAWLDIEPPELTVLPGHVATVSVALNKDAPQTHGEYAAVLTFTNFATGQTQAGDVLLKILENLSVRPSTDVATAAKEGAAFAPAYAVYTLENQNATEAIDWTAGADRPWVRLDPESGTLLPGETTRVAAVFDAQAAPPLTAGLVEYSLEAVVTFQDRSNGETGLRHVHATIVRPIVALDEQTVSALSPQPGGPMYAYDMGTFPITNAEYVAFLNDAIANPQHARGHYLYVDSDTGDVYMNSSVLGQIGAGPAGRSRKLFSPVTAGQVRFAKGRYEIVADAWDYAAHPVSGVSWYGAVKFCNWLTLDQGMRLEDRCYIEDVDEQAGGWRPVTIDATSWPTRDLNDAERSELAGGCRGFRLPMDDGYNNPSPSIDAADDYNEWFKAAAWSTSAHQNALFGFGRNTLGSADANYRCSGDEYESSADCTTGGATPVGYFDGSIKTNALRTSPNENAFGLFDMTGNVHQWLQDRYAPGTIDRRTVRGGSWNDAADSPNLRNTSRMLFATPGTVSAQIGFRVLRVPPVATGDFDGDGRVDLADAALLPTCLAADDGAAADLCFAFDLDSDGDVDLRDTAALFIRFAP